MTDTLADVMTSYYASQLGHSGSLIELEREYFGAASNETWADAARDFYASANGSNPAGTLNDEAYKYYSAISGLSPAANYTLADHMYALFGTGGGHSITPPNTDNLEVFFSADAIDGYYTDGRISKNLLSLNQATADTDTTGFFVGQGTATMARSTALGADVPFIRATLTAVGPVSCGTTTGISGTPVTGGLEYTAVIKIKSTAYVGSMACRIFWYTAAGTPCTPATSQGTALTCTSSFQQVSVTVTAPSDAAFASVQGRFASGIVGDTLDIDDLGLWQGSSTDWVRPGKLHNINLLPYQQSTLEVDSNVTGILGGFTVQTGNCALSRTNAQASHGTYSLGVTATGAAGTISISIYSAVYTDRVPVIAGKTYTFMFKVRSAATPRSVNAQIYWYSASGGASISNVTGTNINSTTSGWTTIWVTAVAPANAVYAYPHMNIVGTVVAETHYIDELGFWEGAQREWVPPYRSTRPADGESLSFWRDISGKNRHAYQNTLAAQPLFRDYSTVVSKNMLTYNQATIETDTTGLAVSQLCTIARSTAQAEQGTASLAITCSGGGTTVARTLNGAQAVPIVAGLTYTAIASFKTAVTARSVRVGLAWVDTGGSFISESVGFTITDSTTQWVKSVATGVAPANAGYAYISLVISGPAAAEVHYVDNLGLWEGTTTDWVVPGPPHYNLLTFNQASIETDTTGLQVSANCTISRITSAGAHGTCSLQGSSLGAGTTRFGVLVGTSGVPCVAGRTYTAVISGQAPTITTTWQVTIAYYDAVGSQITSASSTGVPLTTSFVQQSVTMVAPANAVYVSCRLIWTAVGAGELVRGDKFGIWEGSQMEWKPPVVLPNNKCSVQFDSINDTLSAVVPVGLINVAQSSAYVVLAPNWNPGVTNRRIFQVSGAVLYYMVYGTGGSPTYGLQTTFPNAANLDINAANVLSGVGTSTEGNVYKNGVVGTTDNIDPSGVTAGTALDIGSTAGGAFFPGQIMAILIYSKAHTTAERQSIERWLGAQYGVTVA